MCIRDRDAIEQLQRWWEESEALEPQSRLMTIPVIYGGEDGPDLATVSYTHLDVYKRQMLLSAVGFSNGCDELALKNPPPLVPSILIASCEATGPIGSD